MLRGVTGDNITAPKWWDLTIPRTLYTQDELIAKFNEIGADRFVIGKETGKETGYEHWQCRVVFTKPKEESTIINQIGKDVDGKLVWGYVSPTQVRNFQYCEKEGDFYRSWEGALRKFADVQLREWQKQAIAMMHEQDAERGVDVVYDENGNHGKTFFSKYCVAHRIATYVPPMECAEDLMAFAMAKPDKAYIFDMPRSDDVRKRRGMWSAIEQIKNGYLYDKRYHFVDKWIDPPKVLVFCNQLPDTSVLSADRWRIYEFSETWGTLTPRDYDI